VLHGEVNVNMSCVKFNNTHFHSYFIQFTSHLYATEHYWFPNTQCGKHKLTILMKYCENKESRNGIKSLVWYDERSLIHVHFVPAPFVIPQIPQNRVLLPAVHGMLQGVGI
jgi:hypothetical protein